MVGTESFHDCPVSSSWRMVKGPLTRHDTGSDPPYYCIYNSDNGGLVGVKHQCNLEYDLDVT